MDAETKKMLGLIADAVDAVASAMDHQRLCHLPHGGVCTCGLRHMDEMVKKMCDAVKEMEQRKEGEPCKAA